VKQRYLDAGYAEPEADDLALAEIKALAEADPERFYSTLAKAGPYWLNPLETAAVTERLEYVMDVIESALPNVLNLTNQIGTALVQMEQALAQTEQATTRAGDLFERAQPLVDNLAAISENLRDPEGSLGRWLMPPQLTLQIERTLESAEFALDNTGDELTILLRNANRSLDNLAGITSNLNAQVQANTNILSEVSSAVVSLDETVQGLQQHWLFRSAFRDRDRREERQRRAPEPILPPRLR
jgi:ABC-type transporter Mla subunit MlaD